MTHEHDPPNPAPVEDGPGDAARRTARRQLLRAAVYAVPAILGTFAIARRVEAQSSCLPSCTCRPNCCLPDISCPPWFCRPFV